MFHGSNRSKDGAITLMELLVALVLLTLVVIGISNIEIFSKSVFISADRKAKSINEAGYIVEHMSKFIGMAVGDANNTPVTFDSFPANCTNSVQVWIDNSSGFNNGIWDPSDRQILYCFNNTTHTMTYYDNYTLALSGACELLSRNIANFNSTLSRNSIEVNITGCWNASVSSGPNACGSMNNPKVAVRTRIYMPSVSINASY